MNRKSYSTRVKAPKDPDFAINVRPINVTNDVGILNHTRRITTDNKDKQSKPNKIINHRRFSHIATLNIRTLRQPHQHLELAHLFG